MRSMTSPCIPSAVFWPNALFWAILSNGAADGKRLRAGLRKSILRTGGSDRRDHLAVGYRGFVIRRLDLAGAALWFAGRLGDGLGLRRLGGRFFAHGCGFFARLGLCVRVLGGARFVEGGCRRFGLLARN